MSCPEPNVLAALDDLSETERAAVVDHAASCDSCRGVVLAVMATAHSPGPPPAPLGDAPAQIDRYRVERRIGAGAMGVVFAAYDPELDRRVAVKLLRAGGSAERLRREAQALAKLTHPNVVAVYDAGAFGDGAFVAMALVDGENLRHWLHKPREPEQIIDAIIQAARGVAVAHAAGIIHRDIKPDNIFVGRDGVVLVGDFGLARPDTERPGPRTGELTDSGELTQTGMIIGTPVYMAPEQIAGDATSASDQFSLCVTAWEALYGTRPFHGLTLEAIAASIRRGPPAEPKSQVPKRVHAAIRRGLAADPAERHASVAALVSALERRRRVAPIVVAAVAIVFAAAAITFVAMHRDEPADPVALAIARCDAEPPLQVHTDIGPPLGSKIAKRVDAYTQQWTELRHSSCVATARREMTDPANAAIRACLDRRTLTLRSIVSQLTPDLPLPSLAYVEDLESIESCRHAPARPVPTPAVAALQTTIDEF
ncbi:MAG TPA: serine/threonine-protein kinase, partial [Kofleriaceae bacterium]|nr:serine/threonine-protein kinase [Kofleriaceae bacterium]